MPDAEKPASSAWTAAVLGELSFASTQGGVHDPDHWGVRIAAHACPTGYACVQGLDPGLIPHVLCNKVVVAPASAWDTPWDAVPDEEIWLEPGDEATPYYEVDIRAQPVPYATAERSGELQALQVSRTIILGEDLDEVSVSLLLFDHETMLLLVPVAPLSVTAVDPDTREEQLLCTSWTHRSAVCQPV